MTELERTFPKAKTYTGDVWVADYTLQTQKLPKEERQGVVVSDTELADISCFHLHNDSHVEMLGVNFEEHKGVFPEGCGDCECLFKAKDVNRGGWLLLCELKYGKNELPNNIANARKAFNQLYGTWNLLKEKKVFVVTKCKSFLNVSMPKHGNATPFDSYLYLQDEKLNWLQQNKIKLMGVNDVLIINKGILQVPNAKI